MCIRDRGCMITKIDDVTVDSQTAITAYLTSKKAGDTVTLEVYNGLSQQTFTCLLYTSCTAVSAARRKKPDQKRAASRFSSSFI